MVNLIFKNKIRSRNLEFKIYKKFTNTNKYKNKGWTSKGTSADFWFKANKQRRMDVLIKRLTKLKQKGGTKQYKFDTYTNINELIRVLGYPTDDGFFIVYGGNLGAKGKGHVVNELNRKRILKALENPILENFESGSDADFHTMIFDNDTNKITIQFVKMYKEGRKGRYRRHGGEFFKHMHTMNIDLSRYGILHANNDEYNEYKNEIKTLNCLQMALQIGGLEFIKVDRFIRFIKNRRIAVSDLNKICKKLDICIKLTNYTYKEQTKTRCYGDKDNKMYKVGLLEGHYFINDKETILHKYAIVNYEQIRDKVNWNHIKKMKNKYVNKDKKAPESITIVKNLIANKDKILIPFDLSNGLLNTVFYDTNKEIINLEYSEKDNTHEVLTESEKLEKRYEGCKTLEQTEKLRKALKDEFWAKRNRPTVYFDFETYEEKYEKAKLHTPYLCCSETKRKDGKIIKQAFVGKDCAIQFLRSIKENSLLIAHNLGFDFRFLLSEMSSIRNLIEKNNSIFNVKGCIYNYVNGKNIKIELEFKDSYQLIPKPLSQFGSCFGSKQEKEIMPYGAYNSDTIDKKYMKIEYALRYLKEEDHETFIKNIDRWGLRGKKNKTNFKHLEYSIKYCEIDCEVLRLGYETFKQWMQKVTNLNINDKITICSLAHTYLIEQGCYEGVFALSGIPREFIQLCVVGGRCMSKSNKKYHVYRELQDFDAVSLYPSAMVTLKGFLRGKPKVIINNDYNHLKQYDGFFCEVKINNIPIRRNFPLISELNEDGTRIFSNDIKKTIYLDNITIEDLIEFHGMKPNVDFEIVRGYYFNEGFNEKIKKVINHLFDERVIKKSEDNPIQEVYKLIMNSAYGKSIQKPIETDKKYLKGEEQFLDYLRKNTKSISNHSKVFNLNPKNKKITYIVEKYKTIEEHQSLPQIGVQVLSQSKRIMNQVMCLAEDLGLNIWYQDTDSMHINQEDITILEKTFKEKYGKNLIGSSLGQFHSDFDNKRYDKGVQVGKYELVVSIESYFLGKKCYIDKLRKTYHDANNNKVVDFDFHIRMKGVPSSSIKLHEIDNMEIFEKLSKDEKMQFNLLADPFKVRMEFNSDFTINNRKEFMRRVQFKGETIEINY